MTKIGNKAFPEPYEGHIDKLFCIFATDGILQTMAKILPFFLLFLVLPGHVATGNDSLTVPSGEGIVYVFPIREEIARPAWRLTKKGLAAAQALDADYILIHMNTYGGLLNMADSIRTALLNCPIPTMVFIDNNAASAGALISIACDSIYMRRGATIGAATVVNQTGEQVPDKYQSYMRAMMRATAEAHGRDTIVRDGDTLIRWHRDPRIAEAMVDPRIRVPGISDSGKVLTLTADEAIRLGYCEGKAETIEEVLKKAGLAGYRIVRYEIKPVDKIIGFLASPAVSGILIMIIIGGIYFELRTPGIGFPLAAAILAAILYFAPLYLEGLAEHWEILLFIAGLILIAVEIFVIPGFGVAGISGILLLVAGLTLSLVDNITFRFDPTGAMLMLLRSLAIVLVSALTSIILSIWLTRKAASSTRLGLALNTEMKSEAGYVSVEKEKHSRLIGKKGIAYTVLRPAGKVEIEGELYDAVAELGFIEKGTPVIVVGEMTGQIYVAEAK